MNNIFTLTKVLLKNNNSNFTGSKKKKIATFLLIAFLILQFGFLIFKISVAMYDATKSIGQEGLIIGLANSFVVTIILIFGIIYTMSIFFFSKDIENLLYLPLKPYEILTSKFIVTLVYEYLTELVILAPVIFVYGYKSNAGLLYYIISIIVFLTLPIIPLVLGLFLNMLLMRFTNIAKNKDRLRVISGFIAMLLGIFFNVFMQRLGIGNGLEVQKIISNGNNSSLMLTSKAIPSTKFASLAMINSNSFKGIFYLLTFLFLSLMVYLIFIYIGEKFYINSVSGLNEVSSKKKSFSKKDIGSLTKRNNILFSYALKEIKLLFRIPSYFLNCIAINFLWPLFIMIPVFVQPEALKELPKLKALLEGKENLGIVLIISFVFIVFLTSSNAIASTAISREGENICFMKYIPIHISTQVLAKALSAFIIGMFSTVIISVLIFVILKPTMLFNIVVLASSTIATVYSSLIGVAIDLNMPKLNWDTEVKAVKQNFNVLLSLFLSVVIGVCVTLVVINFKLSLLLTFSFIILIFGSISIILYYYILKNSDKLINKLI